jgi:hypothetical protein
MDDAGTGGGATPGRRKGLAGVSPWVWLGCGCGVLVLLAGLAIGGFVFAGMRQVRDLERLKRDPVALARRIQTILPYRELPAGYEPDLVISVPILTDTAIFARRPPGWQGRVPDNAPRFIYSRTLALGGGLSTEEQRRRFLDPRQGMPSFLRGLLPHAPAIETLRTGTFEAGGHPVYYRVQRALVSNHGERRAIFTTVAMIACPDAMHAHTVVWTDGRFGARRGRAEDRAGRDEEQDNRAGDAEDVHRDDRQGDRQDDREHDRQGDSKGDRRNDREAAAERGDPAAMAAFLSHFQFCGGRR